MLLVLSVVDGLILDARPHESALRQACYTAPLELAELYIWWTGAPSLLVLPVAHLATDGSTVRS